MDSKRHQKRQKMCAEDPNPICLAEDIQGDDTEVSIVLGNDVKPELCDQQRLSHHALWVLCT